MFCDEVNNFLANNSYTYEYMDLTDTENKRDIMGYKESVVYITHNKIPWTFVSSYHRCWKMPATGGGGGGQLLTIVF